MEAFYIRKCSKDSALYKVDPPMKFKKLSLNPLESETVETELVSIWSGANMIGEQCTVIHAAKPLAGEEDAEFPAFSFGAHGEAKVCVGITQHAEALRNHGYSVHYIAP